MIDERSSIEQVIEKLRQAPLLTDPFPHLLVEELLPSAFYAELLRRFPDRSRFREASYPGSGRNRKAIGYQEHGLVCQDFDGNEPFRILRALFASETFARTLFSRFGSPLADGKTPIPPEKHRFFGEGARDYRAVFDLQIDRPGYEIPPHPDVPEKIVTFQLYLTEDDALRQHGTLLCRPKRGASTVDRARAAKLAGRLVERAARRLHLQGSSLYRSLERSDLGLELGVGDTRGWLPWRFFEIVEVAAALPNSFLAFAPNQRSYHAVSMDLPVGSPRHERPVIRGFIRSGGQAGNWLDLVDQGAPSKEGP